MKRISESAKYADQSAKTLGNSTSFERIYGLGKYQEEVYTFLWADIFSWNVFATTGGMCRSLNLCRVIWFERHFQLTEEGDSYTLLCSLVKRE